MSERVNKKLCYCMAPLRDNGECVFKCDQKLRGVMMKQRQANAKARKQAHRRVAENWAAGRW